MKFETNENSYEVRKLEMQIATESNEINHLMNIRDQISMGQITKGTARVLTHALGANFPLYAGVSIESFETRPVAHIALEAAKEGIVERIKKLIERIYSWIKEKFESLRDGLRKLFSKETRDKVKANADKTKGLTTVLPRTNTDIDALDKGVTSGYVSIMDDAKPFNKVKLANRFGRKELEDTLMDWNKVSDQFLKTMNEGILKDEAGAKTQSDMERKVELMGQALDENEQKSFVEAFKGFGSRELIDYVGDVEKIYNELRPVAERYLDLSPRILTALDKAKGSLTDKDLDKVKLIQKIGQDADKIGRAIGKITQTLLSHQQKGVKILDKLAENAKNPPEEVEAQPA